MQFFAKLSSLIICFAILFRKRGSKGCWWAIYKNGYFISIRGPDSAMAYL